MRGSRGPDAHHACVPAQAAVDAYAEELQGAYNGRMAAKLGLVAYNRELIMGLMKLMFEDEADFTNTFRALSTVTTEGERRELGWGSSDAFPSIQFLSLLRNHGDAWHPHSSLRPERRAIRPHPSGPEGGNGQAASELGEGGGVGRMAVNVSGPVRSRPLTGNGTSGPSPTI